MIDFSNNENCRYLVIYENNVSQSLSSLIRDCEIHKQDGLSARYLLVPLLVRLQVEHWPINLAELELFS